MIEREPPAWALWILDHWGSTYHGESLSGDLVEQYQEGRGPAWFCGQALAAVVVARARAVRAMPWIAAGRWLSRLMAEAAAVLAICALADHERRIGAFAGTNPSLFGVLIALVTAAVAGYWASIRLSTRNRGSAAINALLLAFGVLALSLGTVSWADAVRADAGRAAASQAEACLRTSH